MRRLASRLGCWWQVGVLLVLAGGTELGARRWPDLCTGLEWLSGKTLLVGRSGTVKIRDGRVVGYTGEVGGEMLVSGDGPPSAPKRQPWRAARIAPNTIYAAWPAGPGLSVAAMAAMVALVPWLMALGRRERVEPPTDA